MDVSIIGWNMGLNKVGLTKLLMRECAMELSAARSLVKSIVKSDAVTVVVPDEALNGVTTVTES
jgi:hypothetical protein